MSGNYTEPEQADEGTGRNVLHKKYRNFGSQVFLDGIGISAESLIWIGARQGKPLPAVSSRWRSSAHAPSRRAASGCAHRSAPPALLHTSTY
eukprot:6210611-Pleurochrysis_carterae.AAC.5